ncbi:hypothetical protein BGZ94_009796 [Podila epigama]|nr:hypothetical protein BGZ94_009796 [Podila epigama]
MSDNNTNSGSSPQGATATVDPVHQLLHSGTNGQAMTPEQRNERREALLKRQRESRERAQQISQAAKANAASASSSSTTTTTTTTSAAPAVATAATPAPAVATATGSTPPTVVSSSSPGPVSVASSDNTPVRENMVQQAVSFLSSPSVQSADESKKTQFLEKKGLTLKEIELARSRVAAGGGSGSTAPVTTTATAGAPTVTTSYNNNNNNNNNVPPPVPPRTYAQQPQQVQGYPPYGQPVPYYPQQQAAVTPVDPKAFQKKLVLALLISGGVTALTAVIVQKLIYPMVRGITGARRLLVNSQSDLMTKLKERLKDYKDYLLGLELGSNHRRTVVKKTIAKKDRQTTVDDDDDDSEDKEKKSESQVTASTTTTTIVAAPYASTIKQLDDFASKLESRAKEMSFEELKATRALTQDLAEYITKETYALTTSIAYPTSRYYGYNASGAAAAAGGKGVMDATTPESALKSEIRSLKGLLLNWRNFPTAGSGAPGSPSGNALPSLVQQQ